MNIWSPAGAEEYRPAARLRGGTVRKGGDDGTGRVHGVERKARGRRRGERRWKFEPPLRSLAPLMSVADIV